VKSLERRQRIIRARFPVRESLSKVQLAQDCFSQHDVTEVLALFDLIEFEFLIDVGFLRPEDRLDVLFSPVPTRNPLAWAQFRMRETDGVHEISVEVAKKRHKRRLPARPINPIETLGDLVAAWCESTDNRHGT
jgi:hypothetical protein